MAEHLSFAHTSDIQRKALLPRTRPILPNILSKLQGRMRWCSPRGRYSVHGTGSKTERPYLRLLHPTPIGEESSYFRRKWRGRELLRWYFWMPSEHHLTNLTKHCSLTPNTQPWLINNAPQKFYDFNIFYHLSRPCSVTLVLLLNCIFCSI